MGRVSKAVQENSSNLEAGFVIAGGSHEASLWKFLLEYKQGYIQVVDMLRHSCALLAQDLAGVHNTTTVTYWSRAENYGEKSCNKSEVFERALSKKL